MDFYRHLLTNDGQCKMVSFALVYLVSIIFTFQSLLTAYNSSTYLENFTKPEFVGLIYSAGALVAIVISLLLPSILNRVGNVGTILLLMLSITLSLVVIGLGINPFITIVAFVIFLAVSPQIYFNIDIFLEVLVGTDEHTTGSKRGIILTLMSLAAFFSPLTMGYIVGDGGDLANTYFAAAGVGIVFIMIIIAKFRHFCDPVYQQVKIFTQIKALSGNKDMKTVLFNQFLLQIFYTWAIIYFPLYVSTVIGLNWEDIGKIIAVGLLAFVIFEYPIGVVADRHIGEKEMMALGFTILAIASAWIGYLNTTNIVHWMILLFCSRIGASLVEVTTESYFFKQVKGHDSNLIGIFRLMRPLGNLIGAIAGSLAFFFLPFNFIFVILGFIMVIGSFATIRLTDTK